MQNFRFPFIHKCYLLATQELISRYILNEVKRLLLLFRLHKMA